MSLSKIFHVVTFFFVFVLIRSYPVEDVNIGTFWQITDVHWDKQYSPLGDPNHMCHLTINATKDFQSGDYGNFNCDSPWWLINSSVEAMITYKSDPDFIIWTGDNAPHIWNPSPNFKDITSILANITHLLALKFPNSTILPVIGNHDTFPPNTISPDNNSSYYTQYLAAGRWNEILPDTTIDTFIHGGYYSYSLSSNLIILGLNTILWYNFNHLTLNSTDPAGQFVWLENELMNAKNKNKKICKFLKREISVKAAVCPDQPITVYILGHVSPGHSNRGLRNKINPSLFQQRFNEKYIDIVNRYGDVIIGQFFAHLHADVFGLFRDKDQVTSSMLLSPSISPWHSISPGMKGISVSPNPSIRLYYYNRQDGKILDYDQYFLNLTKVNGKFQNKKNDEYENNSTSKKDQTIWELLYTFTKAYNKSDVSTRSLVKLFQNLRQPDTFQKYYNFTSVGKDNGPCDKICIRMHLCAISFLSHSNYSSCLQISGQQVKDINYSTTSAPHNSEMESVKARNQSHSASYRNILIGCTLSLLVLIMILVVVYIKRSRLARGPRFVRFQ